MSTGCFFILFYIYIYFKFLYYIFYIEHEDNVNWLFFIPKASAFNLKKPSFMYN